MPSAVSWLLCLLLTLATVRAGEYCEDFEDGDLGDFWTPGTNQGGQWTPSSYSDLKRTIPDFPPPLSGDSLVYLTPSPSSTYMSARLQMATSYIFPEGSSLSFRYWLRSKWAGSGTFVVRRIIGSSEEITPILSLTNTSRPDNADWVEANVTIPHNDAEFKLLFFGACGIGELSNIAIDDVKVCGPAGLNQKCLPLTTTTAISTTTTEPTTPTEATTSPEPTTTTQQTTTTHTETTATTETATSTESTPTLNPTRTPETGPTTSATLATSSAKPASSTEAGSSTVRPPTSTALTTPAVTSTRPPAPADQRLGPSWLLWAALAVLGASVLLLLLIALGRRSARARPDDQLPLTHQTSSRGSESASSSGGSAGWFDYLFSDPWNHFHDKMRHLRP